MKYLALSFLILCSCGSAGQQTVVKEVVSEVLECAKTAVDTLQPPVTHDQLVKAVEDCVKEYVK